MSKNIRILLIVFGIVALLAVAWVLLGRRSSRTITAVIGSHATPQPTFATAPSSSAGTVTPSPSAKPTPDPAVAGWRTFAVETAGFSFKYPGSIQVNPPQGKAFTIPERYITSDVYAVTDLPASDPSGFDQIISQSDLKALANGAYGATLDWAQGDSSGKIGKVVSLGQTNGKTYLVLHRSDPCDVTLERHLVFYWNGRQFRVGSIMRPDIVTKSATTYMAADPSVCNGKRIWTKDGSNALLADLSAGNATPVLQSWFNEFDSLVGTVSPATGNPVAAKLDVTAVAAAIDANPSLKIDSKDKPITYVKSLTAVGDLNRDGDQDAVAVLSRQISQNIYADRIAVFKNVGGAARYVSSLDELPTNMVVKTLAVANGVVTATIFDRESARTKTVQYRLIETVLVEQ